MPPDVYYALRDSYLQILSSLYTQTATPIEAPEKTTFGDIDILVSQPKSTSTAESLGQVLASARAVRIPGSPITSFALPYPNRPNYYLQLDVHLSPPETFHWQLFHQSHGDLVRTFRSFSSLFCTNSRPQDIWNLLGTTIRPLGLTPNNEGLHVRIEEIEDSNRKRALLFLTCDGDAVLEFLGLDTDAYKRPFGSVDSMYRYVCSSRFFNDASYVRGELKANDRKRMTQRELYRAFVDWLPGNAHLVGQQKEKNAQFSRDDVLEESLNRFGKREEYEKRVEGWRKERKELLAKQMGRQKRKADAAEAEEYAAAWMGWLERNA
ncbi:hypothetical protein IMSHALPRED_002389 [Imshaugia aleurites]|uniref:Uncharacterized protein n=1 Tax=Imshaugia aleurites TaxID=172621 RepID=A0A8H3F1F4_9LECA|nr:hypothetical protein IMSHALPRED_002389 [Imshaugia aleurites]